MRARESQQITADPQEDISKSSAPFSFFQTIRISVVPTRRMEQRHSGIAAVRRAEDSTEDPCDRSEMVEVDRILFARRSGVFSSSLASSHENTSDIRWSFR